MSENVQLRRSQSPAPAANADVHRQMETLYTKNEELLRENAQLRRQIGAGPRGGAEAAMLGQQLAESQGSLKQLMEENVRLRRSADALDPGLGANAADLISAQRQIADLKAR